MSEHVQVLSGRYHDSVTLLATSRAVAAVGGVSAAQVAMATPLNLDVLATMGFAVPPASPDDLVVALRLDDAAEAGSVVAAALAAMESSLAHRPSSQGSDDVEPPRTTAAALRRTPAPLVLVSVPGEHAVAEAWDALDAGSSVMLFSDNVSVADEVALKREAARRGLLVMGPDCGTAVVAGVGLGFANAVRPGPVSLVAASGTGAQHLMCLLDAAGVGVRHCLGLGGRDLRADVGGLGAEQALRLLADDEGTSLVVLVSKPADPGVVTRLEGLASELGVAVEWAVLGAGRPDLTAVAAAVCSRVGVPAPTWPSWSPAATSTARQPGLLRGLFSGGTLCDEALAVAGPVLGPIASNLSFDPSWPRLDASGPTALSGALASAGHAMVDLGDDNLTVGRAHPMIDPSLRLEALAVAFADPRVRVVLLDVVLGHGPHPDPAAELGPAITAGRDGAGRPVDVVVSLTGAADDPQGTTDQARRLVAAGAHVHASNAAATRHAVALTSALSPPRSRNSRSIKELPVAEEAP